MAILYKCLSMKIAFVLIFVLSIAYVHLRGRVRHKLTRQLGDHSSFLAPINSFLYLFSRWYGETHPSAMTLCPRTTELLQGIGTVKAAMFATLPPGAKLVRHRDPYAGSYRYHLGLDTPNDDGCYIDVDGEKYSWRDGEAVIFDETYIHYAANTTEHNRIILFCDVERPLKYRWASAFNRWFSRKVMAAAAAPNNANDKTGAINRLFTRIYKIRERGKALKKRNRMRYYLEKWLVVAALVLVFIYI